MEMNNESWKRKASAPLHKVIEKRRRDRINHSLAEMTQLVPPMFCHESQGKLEKAEIMEMAVRYIKAVQATDISMRLEHGMWLNGHVWTDFMQAFQAGYNAAMHEAARCFDNRAIGSDATSVRTHLIGQLKERFGAHASFVYSKTYENCYQQVQTLNSLQESVNRAEPLLTNHLVISDEPVNNGIKTEPIESGN